MAFLTYFFITLNVKATCVKFHGFRGPYVLRWGEGGGEGLGYYNQICLPYLKGCSISSLLVLE